MSYTLEAVLLDAQGAKFNHQLPVYPLLHGVTLIPITAELLSERFGFPDLDHAGPFWKLGPALETLLTEISQAGAVAYVEADYFGGTGTQVAAVWWRGQCVLGPVCSDGAGAINHALRRLGVPHSAERDAFDEVGLGRFRHTEEWMMGSGPEG